MKVRLSVSRERYEELRAELEKRGIEVDPDAPLVLSESGGFADRLMAKDGEARVLLPVEEITGAESFGREVLIYARRRSFRALEPLYKVQAQLDPEKFLRVSHSALVAAAHVVKIKPSFSMKFRLTLSDGREVDVTRSYYYGFREFWGI